MPPKSPTTGEIPEWMEKTRRVVALEKAPRPTENPPTINSGEFRIPVELREAPAPEPIPEEKKEERVVRLVGRRRSLFMKLWRSIVGK